MSWRRRKGGHPWHDHKAKAATRFFSCGQSFIGVWRDPPSSIPHTPPSSFYSSSSSPFPSSSSFSPPLPPPHSAQARARIDSQRIQSNRARIRFLTFMRRWHALGSERERERERERIARENAPQSLNCLAISLHQSKSVAFGLTLARMPLLHKHRRLQSWHCKNCASKTLRRHLWTRRYRRKPNLKGRKAPMLMTLETGERPFVSSTQKHRPVGEPGHDTWRGAPPSTQPPLVIAETTKQ